MPRYATVAPHLAVDELQQRYRQAHDPVARSHWHIVWLVAQGQHVPDVARLVGYSPNWVRAIVRRYNTATGTLQAIGAACSGTINALTCTESGVPFGSWQYTITPAASNWRGPESAKSPAAVI